MWERLSGSSMAVSEEQFPKAENPMLLRLCGRLTDVSAGQSQKADSLIAVTPSAISTEVRAWQPEKP